MIKLGSAALVLDLCQKVDIWWFSLHVEDSERIVESDESYCYLQYRHIVIRGMARVDEKLD